MSYNSFKEVNRPYRTQREGRLCQGAGRAALRQGRTAGGCCIDGVTDMSMTIQILMTTALLGVVLYGVASAHAHAVSGPSPEWEIVLGLGGFAMSLLSLLALALLAIWA